MRDTKITCEMYGHDYGQTNCSKQKCLSYLITPDLHEVKQQTLIVLLGEHQLAKNKSLQLINESFQIIPKNTKQNPNPILQQSFESNTILSSFFIFFLFPHFDLVSNIRKALDIKESQVSYSFSKLPLTALYRCH